MESEEDKYRRFQESLEHLQGHFYILDTNVPVETQMDYFRYSERIKKRDRRFSVEEAIELLHSDEPDEEKEYAMVVLAISGDVKAYRILEAYAQHPEESLKDWAELSFLQAKMTLESEFLDEKQIFISTGLGGKGDMLRFYAFFKAKDLQPFSPYQVQLIEKEISFSINEVHGVVEELSVHENYFYLIFLINIKSNIKSILEKAVIECNQYGDFIDQSFIITNVKIFDEEDIKRELKGKKSS